MEKQKISKKENDNSLTNVENSVWKGNDVLANVIKEIEKDFGKGSVMLLDGNSSIRTESISSGSFLIDKAIGIGGYPKGRIIEIYGPESSGKTTLALHAIAQAQLANGVAAFIDAEHSLDPKYAKNLGVNIESLIVSQPDYGEQALDILESLVKSNVVDIVVVDSVAALVPKAELEGEMGDQLIGLQARLMSKALRKLNGIISKTNTVVIFINQLREKVGVMFGNPEVTSGGKALKFFSSLRLEVRRGEQITANGEIIGNKAKIKVVKNKVAPPFKIAQVSILYNKGIDKLEEIIDMGVLYNVLTKSGVWYSYKDQKIGQGKTSVIEWFNKDEQNLELVRKEIESIIDSSYNDK